MPNPKIVKITVSMGSPVVLTVDSDLCLDGLLCAVHPALHGDAMAHPTRQSTTPIKVPPLPLLRAERGGDWVWLCTCAEADSHAAFKDVRMAKRRDGADVYYAERVFQPATGRMKNRVLRGSALITATLTWHAASNDPPELVRLMKRIKHLGCWRHSGYGEVLRIDAEEYEYDYGAAMSLLFGVDGMTRRAIPSDFGVGEGASQIMCTRPPYWNSASRVTGYASGSRVKPAEGIRIT